MSLPLSFAVVLILNPYNKCRYIFGQLEAMSSAGFFASNKMYIHLLTWNATFAMEADL